MWCGVTNPYWIAKCSTLCFTLLPDKTLPTTCQLSLWKRHIFQTIVVGASIMQSLLYGVLKQGEAYLLPT